MPYTGADGLADDSPASDKHAIPNKQVRRMTGLSDCFYSLRNLKYMAKVLPVAAKRKQGF